MIHPKKNLSVFYFKKIIPYSNAFFKFLCQKNDDVIMRFQGIDKPKKM